jgi:Cu(I)/Ag(I) efflux system protein CusF
MRREILWCLPLLWMMGPVLAQQAPRPVEAASAASPAAPARTIGEVRRIDLANGRVTVRHAEIAHLNMPAMAMDFVARDPALLNGLKVGDKVRFVAIDEGGTLVITRIERVGN